jgi:hypothetical protein
MKPPLLPRLARALGFAALALPAFSQPIDEYALLRSMPTYPLSRNTGGVPDERGLVGSNQRNYPIFTADGQRGAMDSMVVGIALRGRGEIPDATCDLHVENGMFAIETTYALQTPQGDFSGRSDRISATGNGPEFCHFFLAWSNRALWLALRDPVYGQRYGDRIWALYPKVEKAMDYLVNTGGGVFGTSSGLSGDWHSANRSAINAVAFLHGYRLLQAYSPPAKLAAYRGRGREWLRNVLEINNPYLNGVTGTPLLRAFDGVYLERPPGSPAGQDTSYQGVANRFVLYSLLIEPDLIPNGWELADLAGRWFESRFLPDPSDPTRCHIDTTDNTRSGLGNQEGSSKTHDRNSGLQALLYHAALFDYPASNLAAERLARLPNVPAAERTNLPPTVYGPAHLRLRPGEPVSFNVLASNAGLTADPAFALDLEDVPAWLTVGPLQLNKSTGWRVLSGTVPHDLSWAPSSIAIRTASRHGDGQPAFLHLLREPPGAGTDGDGDGLDDLLDYALGGDPETADADTVRPLLRRDGARVGLSFSRLADPALRYRVRQSTDLSTWTDLWDSALEPAPDALRETLEVWAPAPDMAPPPVFLRLEVEPAS